MTPRHLPLFPLPLVVFPRATQALHIFEPRYRQLLADALAGSRQFGMILRAPDVAEREIPAGTVGCTVSVESAETLPDGRSNILVVGGDRFVLRGFVASPAPYHVGEVEGHEDAPESAALSDGVARRAREAFARIARAARTIQDDKSPIPTLPDDAAALAFAIAQHVDLPLLEKQGLLASRSPSERLRRVEELLTPFIESVEMRAHVHVRAHTNGHGAH